MSMLMIMINDDGVDDSGDDDNDIKVRGTENEDNNIYHDGQVIASP